MPQDRVGVLFLIILTLSLTPCAAMSFFMEDRQYYGREAGARLYGALPYHLANASTEALVCVVNAALEAGVAMRLAGLPLSGRFWPSLLLMISHHLSASALVQMCARFAPNQDVAFVLSAAYIVPCLLFANVLVKVQNVAPLLAGIRWACEMFYAVAGLVELEFAGVTERGLAAGDSLVQVFAIRGSSDSADAWTLSWTGCLASIWVFTSSSAPRGSWP